MQQCGAPVGTLSARLLSTTLPPPLAMPQQQMARHSSRYLVSTSNPANVNTTRDSRSSTAHVVVAIATATGRQQRQYSCTAPHTCCAPHPQG